jgi:hypothetical protein
MDLFERHIALPPSARVLDLGGRPSLWTYVAARSISRSSICRGTPGGGDLLRSTPGVAEFVEPDRGR